MTVREMTDAIRLGGSGGGGGGSSVNSVVTVTGTVAEPFGSIDPAELRTAITSNNASVKLVVDASQIGYNDPIRLVGNNASAGNIYFEVIGKMNSTNGIKAVVVNYDFTGAFYDALVAENSVVTSLKQYASLLTTTLTVIYHPLPDSGEEGSD